MRHDAVCTIVMRAIVRPKVATGRIVVFNVHGAHHHPVGSSSSIAIAIPNWIVPHGRRQGLKDMIGQRGQSGADNDGTERDIEPRRHHGRQGRDHAGSVGGRIQAGPYGTAGTIKVVIIGP